MAQNTFKPLFKDKLSSLCEMIAVPLVLSYFNSTCKVNCWQIFSRETAFEKLSSQKKTREAAIVVCSCWDARENCTNDLSSPHS